MDRFELVSDYAPAGDQPRAIEKLVEGLESGLQHQVLLGVTGSGKTFTLANVIAAVNRPTLVLSHNKVLAAQLYAEFRGFFPHNAVGYFVSYYDFYQPEAYIPGSDTYIEKEVTINDELDRLRLAATTALLERRDVLIVASVSCIYGLGSPQEYREMMLRCYRGQRVQRREILRKLVDLQYERNDHDFHRGAFRVAGDTIDIYPAYGEIPVRIEMFDDEIERIAQLDPLKGSLLDEMSRLTIYPAKHFVTTQENMNRALAAIADELEERLAELRAQNKLLEAQRLEQRTRFDMEMMREIGYCQGIENYSRHLDGRAPGQPPNTLIDYFPDDFLLIVDESHITLPQVRGMWGGDRSRKRTLVDYGFRLPSALDNRPLSEDEFNAKIVQAIYVSATPAELELSRADQVVEQIIRPTGLVDPEVVVAPATGQVDDLVGRVRERVARGERTLVTTLTKRMAEDLSEYLKELGIKVHYMHFQIDTLERIDIMEGLRAGVYDVIVGVNLLREGLDFPEVSLVAILDADKEGFLRDERSLIQVAGRAARNVAGQVVMYADHPTDSMRRALAEMARRRNLQLVHNRIHKIEPRTIQKQRSSILEVRRKQKHEVEELLVEIGDIPRGDSIADKKTRQKLIAELKRKMFAAAKDLEFEKAAVYRDKILELSA
ncbi:excinuclease ABC subunit UvrB [bacterium]|nr:excinuclease ABC subunit UvrB [bacterium]